MKTEACSLGLFSFSPGVFVRWPQNQAVFWQMWPMMPCDMM